MKYAMVLLVGVFLTVSPVLAEQQSTPPKPGPEHEKMSSMVGEWTCEASGDVTFTQKCEWFGGGFFVECTSLSKRPSGDAETRMVMGFDRNENAYTMYRYWSTGSSDFSKGWLRDKTWTWIFEGERRDGKLRRRQAFMTETSADTWAFKWEYSVEGEPWRVTQEGKCNKIK